MALCSSEVPGALWGRGRGDEGAAETPLSYRERGGGDGQMGTGATGVRAVWEIRPR